MKYGMTGLVILMFAVAITAAEPTFDYQHYAKALKAYVDERGMVNYRELKANPAELDAFLTEIAAVDPAEFAKWDEKAQIAFWINAYNGLTLKAIIDHYPIKASFFASFEYPKNSIRQISGVWTDLKWTVMGREMTLDSIEHATLRKEFAEPRIHFTLVCAAMGCPPLRNEPYVGAKLDAQLADQAKRFIANPEKFRVDMQDGVVYLSPIFKWFGDDFVAKYAPAEGFGDHKDTQKAVLNFLSRFLDKAQADYVRNGEYKVTYLDYDWSLNEQ